MKQREARSWVVTGSFLFVLWAFTAAGFAPTAPALQPQRDAGPDLEHYVPDAQFRQYLEYRVALENGSNCQ